MKIHDLFYLTHHYARRLTKKIAGASEVSGVPTQDDLNKLAALYNRLREKAEDVYEECVHEALISGAFSIDDGRLEVEIIDAMSSLTWFETEEIEERPLVEDERLATTNDPEEPYNFRAFERKRDVCAPIIEGDGKRMPKEEECHKLVLLERLLGLLPQRYAKKTGNLVKIEGTNVFLMINTGRREYEFVFPLGSFEQ